MTVVCVHIEVKKIFDLFYCSSSNPVVLQYHLGVPALRIRYQIVAQ
jgi:hypothetical protein